MELSKLSKTKQFKKAKRLGRGESSGKGKTSGKGYKGQKARGTIRIGFEGGQLPLIKRLPFRRGVGNDLAKNTLTLTLEQLKVFGIGETVDKGTLLEKGLIRKTDKPLRIKIVAKGSLDKALKIKVSVTPAAKKEIEKASGTIIEIKKEEKINNA